MRIGVIGTGLLGKKHAGTVYNHPDTNLIAVAELRSTVGSCVAKQFDTNFYGSDPEMLPKEDLDDLIVATPDPLHAKTVVTTAKAGVPTILTKKPLATTPSDARRKRNAVHRANSELYILFPNRFDPLDRAVRYAFAQRLGGGGPHLDDSITA